MLTLKYIIEVIICSGLFLVFYRWMIARKVGFRLCRIYLMVTMLMSAAIPAMDVPVYTVRDAGAMTALEEFMFSDEWNMPEAEEASAIQQEGATASAAPASDTEGATPAGKRIDLKKAAPMTLSVIYALVALTGLGLIGYNAARIGRLRRRSELTHTDEYTLAEHVEITTPFSFLKTIFMGFNYEPQERRQIITHEASHVRHRHSYERLILSSLRALYWFNPFYWMAEKDLEEVQEWEADKDVLSEGHELKSYRTTIFKQLFGYNPDISCGLNHSLTKQRFIMMTQSHRGKGAWLRLAATLPVIAAMFFAFGCGAKQVQTNDEDTTNPTNGTEQTYIQMAPPCNAEVRNAFGKSAGADGKETLHSGIDYVLDEGEPVYAAADGEISSITKDDGNGLMVTLKHENGIETRYAHLSKVNIVSEISITGPDAEMKRISNYQTNGGNPDWTITGKVEKGQRIGYAGSTGRATGPHLHFEVRKDGTPVDPTTLFTSDKFVKAPMIIEIADGTKNKEKFFIFCDGKWCKTYEEVYDAVCEYFKGEDMAYATATIKADDNIPMEVVTNVKEQMRKASALRVKYETATSQIDRKLPPAPSDAPDALTATYPEAYSVNRRNIIVIKVNPQGEMFMGDTYVKGSLHDETLYRQEIDRLKVLISNPDDNPDCPEIVLQDIELPDGTTRQFMVSKGMVSFQTDAKTPYEDYTKAMELIITAYNELREDLSQKTFSKAFRDLNDAERQTIYRAVPLNVSESAPRNRQ